MKITVLTGAGISAESGIRTFRDNNGLWEDHPIEDVATPEGFARNPHLVYEFYNQRRRQLLQANIKPNQAHYALAALEQVQGIETTIVTQNVDDLHERAGSKAVIHMHGQLLKAKCCRTGKSFAVSSDVGKDTPCQCCIPHQNVRPDIVWFGEIPYCMEEIESILIQTDTFISIGTSGNVYPAAGFCQLASRYGAKTVELNLEASEIFTAFDKNIYGPATKIVPEFIDALLASADFS